MKTIQKYVSFEDMKSAEKKISDDKAQLKKHTDFQKVIMEIYSVKAKKTKQ